MLCSLVLLDQYLIIVDLDYFLQVHEHTNGVSVAPGKRNHLTVLEVMMLKHPELLKKNLKLLEADNLRLESLIAWQGHEDNFWKWMVG